MVIFLTKATLWAAPFQSGDLVIYRIDDGSTALYNGGNYAFLDEYTTNGTLVQTIPLPTNQFVDANGNTNYPVQNSGVATSEGYMNLSTDGRYLVFAGYATNSNWSATGYTSGGLPLSTNVPRMIGTIDSLGNINTTTAFLGNFIDSSGGNPRSVVSTDGSNFWISGSTEGVCYTTLGSNNVTGLDGAVDKRNVGIYGQRPDFRGYPPNSQQLYVMNATAIWSVGTNLPTSVAKDRTLPPFSTSDATAPPTESPYQFVMLSLLPGDTNIDTLYIADEGSNVAKWCTYPNTTNWVNYGSINTAIGPNALAYPCGTRGITASVTVNGAQTNVNLYITAGCGAGGGGFLYAVTDSAGYEGTLTTSQLPTPIASVGSEQVFRGVAFAPVNTFQVTSVAASGNDMQLTWNGMAGRSYIVQTNSPAPDGSFNSTTWANLSPTNWEVGTGPAGLSVGVGPVQGSYVDTGGATNGPSRYYRVQIVPER